MEFLITIVLFSGVALLCLIMPETQTEKDAVENRRLRKQRQRGNYDATPRRGQIKTDTYYKELKISQEIKAFCHGDKIKLNESHLSSQKSLIKQIKNKIASLDSNDNFYQEFYGEMLTESEDTLKVIEGKINN